MTMHVRPRVTKWAFPVFAPIVALVMTVFVTSAVQAGTIEGCDPAVMTAMQAVAEARVATATAVNDSIYTMDDSVLALTCFNKAASVAAQQAGKIFSGDFTAALTPVINDALTAMYDNFAQNSVGGKSGTVDYSSGAATMPTSPDTSFNCDQVSKLWDTVNSSGIKDGVPSIDFDVLVGGSSVVSTKCDSMDPAMCKSLQSPASQHALDAAKAAMGNVTHATQPTFDKDDDSTCKVLKKAGVLPPATTCAVSDQEMHDILE